LKVGPKKKEAERVLVREVARLHNGPYRELKKITFAEFAKKWMSDYAGGAVKASTYESYDSVLRMHLLPVFGTMDPAKITLEDVQRYVATKQQEGRVQPKTINNTLVPLKEMFTHAVRWSYLCENPAHYVEKPRVPHREMDFLTKEEMHRFLSAVPQDRYPFFLTAILTGMRLGELLAMKWRHVDWHRGQYFVKQSLDKGRLVEPKSVSSKRAINLPRTLLEVLPTHKVRQSGKRLEAPTGRGSIPGSRFNLLHSVGDATRSRECGQAAVLAVPKTGRLATDTLSRSTAHLRHATDCARRIAEVYPDPTGPCLDPGDYGSLWAPPA
jgi:integrase